MLLVEAIVGHNHHFQHVLRTARLVAKSKVSILIQGETGTGKERLARYIHTHSRRSAGPFVAVNCAAIPASLVEAELFGSVRGAFTGAVNSRRGLIQEASRGTLLLDEIGEIPREVQAKLLRVIEEGAVRPVGSHRLNHLDVRFLAATNTDLERAADSGEFRPDLYFRLAGAVLTLPPLRQRPDDIPELLQHFLSEATEGRTTRLHDDTLKLLQTYHWPGNIRQLKNVTETLVALAAGSVIRPEHLPAQIQRPRAVGVAPPPPEMRTLAEVERDHIATVLRNTHGNLSAAANVMGIHRNTLRAKLKLYALNK